MTFSIDVSRVSVMIDGQAALSDLTFHLDGGKIYGLLGRNGACKSTLLSLLAALRKPTAGTILIDGAPLFENYAITRRITLIRESPDVLDDDEKLAYNLGFAAAMRPNWDSVYAAELIEKFRIPAHQKIRSFSRGQRSALGIVLGLASRAPLTMFDESDLGLDPPSRVRFYDELLADFMRFPRTIILSTHLIEEVAALFEEIIILDRGRVLAQEEPEQLRSRARRFTGQASEIDALLEGESLLGVRELGPTKSAVVISERIELLAGRALETGIAIEPLGLQELVVHLTQVQEAAEIG